MSDETVRRLRALIRARELMPGERLGVERALAESLGVSRADLRSALERMEADHEIRRTIGRGGGVFVSDGRLERNINTVESLPAIARRQGRVLRSRVLRAVIAPASPSDIRLLELDGPHPMVYDITRLRLIEGTPLSLEISRLPAALFPGLLTLDLTEPFYTLFERDYGVRPACVDETLETVLADPDQAASLGVRDSDPLVRIRRVARSGEGTPFERATDVYVASRMRFTMHHSGYVRLSATQR
ncbi:GntR family transcriptional regulator [Bifidobacterium lemurum]|uniref:GntR family transcriptional regulator n=1 Tax=Bifidobacterium lemurum TaxID=1603886 RepID=A0A261FW36_9BIFI|nr:GntR family transcriptional regulator [Bifidobacterium lemurum]OZG63153.1 GntR family transcriptional regulator [Bifidobacterium lemurum]